MNFYGVNECKVNLDSCPRKRIFVSLISSHALITNQLSEQYTSIYTMSPYPKFGA